MWSTEEVWFCIDDPYQFLERGCEYVVEEKSCIFEVPEFLHYCTPHRVIMDGRDHVTKQPAELLIELRPCTHGVPLPIQHRA